MNIVDYDEYHADKAEFFQKHGDFTTETKGTSAEYYSKTYVFEDNAIWYEVMRKVYETATVDIKKCHVKVEVAFMQTEYWSNTNSESKFYYEPWDTSERGGLH